MFRQLGPTEILVILGVVLLLFGGKKLPELARGSGRALRIFKTEVKSLSDDDDDPDMKRDALESAEADKKPEQG
jgi:sec-independent protein translocase protein TatA